ncbi:MAG: hypothetical protein GW767_01280 [Rhodobacterales bacterium]|nr:hypothetical protein [Rhodobacterales bacterium]
MTFRIKSLPVVSLAILGLAIAVLLARHLAMTIPTPNSDRLFAGAPREIIHIARAIERGQPIGPSDIAPVADRLNDRFGHDITLLFHALGSANIAAVDALLAAGSDPRQTDLEAGSGRDFIYYLGSPGGTLLSIEQINDMLRSDLAHGGDPNAMLLGETRKSLIASLAVIGNEAGVVILLAAGADPWRRSVAQIRGADPWRMSVKADIPTGETAMTRLASEDDHFDLLDRLIDDGGFDALPAPLLDGFLASLSGYAQRGDPRSLSIKATAMRVLKRNPGYEVPPGHLGVARIFEDHWSDPTPGTIPWDIILSDAV